MSTTPFMSLLLPTVSVTLGPTYATENNTAFTTIDSHDHTSGQGVAVPTAGLNINADLAFNGFNSTLLRSSRYSAQGSPLALVTDKGCLYVAGVDLYYNDGNGNQIQLTAGGALNAASIGGIGGDYTTSTASVFYTSATKTFTFWQNTNKSALMDIGSILLRRVDNTSSAAITIKPSTSLSAGYTLTLPIALPVSTSFVGVDSSGNFAFGNSLVSLDLSAGLTVGASIIPSNNVAYLGGSSNNFLGIYLNDPGSTGGRINFAGASSWMEATTSAALSLGGSFTSFSPAVNGALDLGTNSFRWSALRISQNIGASSTPDANTLYGDLIPKAWAFMASTGTLFTSVNLTGSRSGVGAYVYVFRRNMSTATYAVTATAETSSIIVSITAKSTSSFTIVARNTSSVAVDVNHSVMVLGNQ